MVELIIAGLSNYSWVFVCLFLVGWALVRWAHYRLNKSTLKPRLNLKKKRPYSKRLNFYLRYFKRATTGRNYEKTSTKLDIYLFCVFIGSIVLVPIGLFLNGTQSWSISPDPMEWGVVGDFFGGTLNPILAFASFIALLYTIRIQSEELRLTREEFAKSVAEQKKIAFSQQSGARAQIGMVRTYSKMIRSQEVAHDLNLLIKPIREKINLVNDLLFYVDNTPSSTKSLFCIFQQALKELMIETSLENVDYENLKESFQKLLVQRRNPILDARIERIQRELEIVDYLLGKLYKINSSVLASQSLKSELDMQVFLCGMMSYRGLAVRNLDKKLYLRILKFCETDHLNT